MTTTRNLSRSTSSTFREAHDHWSRIDKESIKAFVAMVGFLLVAGFALTMMV